MRTSISAVLVSLLSADGATAQQTGASPTPGAPGAVTAVVPAEVISIQLAAEASERELPRLTPH